MNHPDSQACEACSSIPSELWAQTGRGESLYPKIEQLVHLDLDNRNDLYVCPVCEAIFEWEDFTQLSGSGNNDEERVLRLGPEQAAVVRELLDPDPRERDGEALLERAFRLLSDAIVYNVLRYRARHEGEAFVGLVHPIVARLMEGDGSLSDIVTTYCSYNRGRIAEVLRQIDSGGQDISQSARFLRETLIRRIEEANRYRSP